MLAPSGIDARRLVLGHSFARVALWSLLVHPVSSAVRRIRLSGERIVRPIRTVPQAAAPDRYADRMDRMGWSGKITW